jgi:hypothetical protein
MSLSFVLQKCILFPVLILDVKAALNGTLQRREATLNVE